jgi:hypothetical protein
MIFVSKVKVYKNFVNSSTAWPFLHDSNMQGGCNKLIASLFVHIYFLYNICSIFKKKWCKDKRLNFFWHFKRVKIGLSISSHFCYSIFPIFSKSRDFFRLIFCLRFDIVKNRDVIDFSVTI